MKGDGADNSPYALVKRPSFFKFQILIPEQTICWVASPLSSRGFQLRTNIRSGTLTTKPA